MLLIKQLFAVVKSKLIFSALFHLARLVYVLED